MDRTSESGARVALFLDFDGTLVDIAATPDSVVIEPGLADRLVALRERLDGAVAIVTGRSVAVIDGFVPGLGLDVCGLHGLERRIGGALSRPEPAPGLREGVAELTRRLAGEPGLLVEDKGVGVAVHWRLAPQAEPLARAAIDVLAASLGPAFRVQDGKAVRELVPADAGKDGAVRTLMDRAPYRGRVPVFVGDDRTDEHGFEAVREFGGVGVKIGPGPTSAQRRIDSPAAFRSWLAEWDGGLGAVQALRTA